MKEELLRIENLNLNFNTFDGDLQILDNVNIAVGHGESVGIVGETGCGKSLTAKSILGLVPSPPAEIRSGRILFENRNLLEMSERQMREVRGTKIAMIFQDPMTHLNPLFTIGTQLVDVILANRQQEYLEKPASRSQARDLAVKLLEQVQLPNPERQIDNYPHQLSGGMRQRVLIAMALSGSPRLLIADEPTTALDVTIQAQILRIIRDLQKEFGMSVIIITHDLGVVAELCERVIVMYAGQVVEDASIHEIFENPLHPYTRGLLRAIPHPGKKEAKLHVIPGGLPNLLNPPSGCRFMERCEHADQQCLAFPEMKFYGENHRVACWYSEMTSHA